MSLSREATQEVVCLALAPSGSQSNGSTNERQSNVRGFCGRKHKLVCYLRYYTHREYFREVSLDMRNWINLLDEFVHVNDLMLILCAHLRP